MPKKRKLFTGNLPIGGVKPVKSRRIAREVTGLYHELRNALAATSDAGQAAALEKQLEAMGGTAAYQAASVISTRNFKTSRWVLGQGMIWQWWRGGQ